MPQPLAISPIPKRALPVLFLVFVSCSNHRVVEHCGGLDEPVAKSLVARGWLPTQIPADAGEIAVIYDRDTRVHCGRFTFGKKWKPLGMAVTGQPKPPSLCRHLPGWPRELPSSATFQILPRQASYTIFATSAKGNAYFWVEPESS